jgi:hypothetical protein
MHNLISYNQLAGWKKFEETVERASAMEDAINEYFECLIECDDSQPTCKRICKTLLSDRPLAIKYV